MFRQFAKKVNSNVSHLSNIWLCSILHTRILKHILSLVSSMMHFPAGGWHHHSEFQGVCVGWLHVIVSKWQKWDHFSKLLPILVVLKPLRTYSTNPHKCCKTIRTICVYSGEQYFLEDNYFLNAAAYKLFFYPHSYIEL